MSVKDVPPEEDLKAFTDNYNYYLDEMDRTTKQPAKKMEDFEAIIKNINKHQQIPPQIRSPKYKEGASYEDAQITFYNVNYTSYDRAKRVLRLEIDSEGAGTPRKDHPDINGKYWITLENVLEVVAKDLTEAADITIERSCGGTEPLFKWPDYHLQWYLDRGKCQISWDKRGEWKKEAPTHQEGFEVYCKSMTPIEYYEMQVKRWTHMAKWNDDCKNNPPLCARQEWLKQHQCDIDLEDDIGPEADKERERIRFREEKERQERAKEK